MTYDKEFTLNEKFERFCNDELMFNTTEVKEITSLDIELTYNHHSMDEETFKAKMMRYCELIMSGLFKRTLKDSFNDYLEGKLKV